MAIDAGKLRHRIRVEAKQRARSASGEAKKQEYQKVADAWSEVLRDESVATVIFRGQEVQVDRSFRTRFIRGIEHRDDLCINFEGLRHEVLRIENPRKGNIELIWHTRYVR